MAFKTTPTSGGSGNFEPRNYPVPKAGSRKARVSLIVDMGIQPREPFVDQVTKEEKPQEPCQQIAVFADLVADRVDYGGDIGEAQYRLPLNNVFKGEFRGINFYTQPQKDADGKIMRDRPYALHPSNILTKLCKAVEHPEWAEEPKPRAGVDIEPLLGLAFMAQVEVKITKDKNGKTDNDGNIIEYKNVNFKGSAPVPEGYPVEDLDAEPMAISFSDAKPEQIKFIRSNLLKQIKLASNYAGSQMQKAVEAYEAEQAKKAKEREDKEEKGEPEKAPAPKPQSKVPPKPKKTTVADMDDDTPF